jgi:soluble cytochrome b562
MAKNVESGLRQNFLEKLSPVIQKKNEVVHLESEVLDEIESIKEGILDKTEEEPDWDEYYDDEDSLLGYEEFIKPLSDLFDKVEALFDYGHHEIAKKAYEELFSIFDINDDYGRGIRIYNLENTDLDEARAKYLRSIYLTEKSENRLVILLDIMEKFGDLDFQSRPKLNDIINISMDVLPELSQFLQKWINATKESSKPQYDAWHREATMLLHGSAGMESLAKTEGNKRPRVYVDWIQGLINEKNYKAALDVVNTAFKKLPKNLPIRAAIADLMMFCGQKLKDKKIEFNGLWFSFEAKPSLSKLIDLYSQCNDNNRLQQMRKAAELIGEHMNKSNKYDYERSWERDNIEIPAMLNSSLLLHAYLFSDENNKAFELAKKGKPLGWSTNDNPQPLFIAYYLMRLTKKSPEKSPTILKKFWDYALDISQDSIWDYGTSESDSPQQLKSIYQKLLSVPCVVDEKIINWCLIASEKRVHEIVSNQHRKAYDRAALLTAACTEALELTNSTEATKFFNKIKNKFPRHPAFQAELKKIK